MGQDKAEWEGQGRNPRIVTVPKAPRTEITKIMEKKKKKSSFFLQVHGKSFGHASIPAGSIPALGNPSHSWGDQTQSWRAHPSPKESLSSSAVGHPHFGIWGTFYPIPSSHEYHHLHKFLCWSPPTSKNSFAMSFSGQGKLPGF